MATCWLVLTATLPTTPSGLRVRVWRALRATGAAALREGVYVLPDHAASAQTLRDLEGTIVASGADAHLLVVAARDPVQERSFRALFDRSELYGELLQSTRQARAAVARASESQRRKSLRELEAELRSIRASDFFPSRSSEKAAAAVAALRRDVERRLSPDEPSPASVDVAARTVAGHQGRTWATRRRPFVDRLATAWLIRRFIDRRPRFVWLDDPKRCPKSALGYDFDGATFTHVGERVTFEVVAASFGLLGDAALGRLGEIVHCVDVGGVPVDEAPGLELLVRGLQARHADDDALLKAALPVFDALYAALRVGDDS